MWCINKLQLLLIPNDWGFYFSIPRSWREKKKTFDRLDLDFCSAPSTPSPRHPSQNGQMTAAQNPSTASTTLQNPLTEFRYAAAPH